MFAIDDQKLVRLNAVAGNQIGEGETLMFPVVIQLNGHDVTLPDKPAKNGVYTAAYNIITLRAGNLYLSTTPFTKISHNRNFTDI
jgi:hypothetical protein